MTDLTVLILTKNEEVEWHPGLSGEEKTNDQKWFLLQAPEILSCAFVLFLPLLSETWFSGRERWKNIYISSGLLVSLPPGCENL